jgi:threonine aldolase
MISEKRSRQFASDNYAGICPEVMALLEEANAGHVQGYGNDPWTRKATRMIRDLFETNCEVFFVFNGTAANSLALASICEPFNSALCYEYAHVATDECGAPGFFAHGTKLVPLPGISGKISPRLIEQTVRERSDVHFVKPRVVSITQATELGTVYSVAEVTAIGKTAHKLGLQVHMDGARFANAVAELKIAPKQLTWKAGVDVLCFGGTKNGMSVGEAVVFFNQDLARNFDYRRKQSGQLSSKMRFIAAQWIGLLKNDVWLRNATYANSVARKLEKALRSVPRTKILYPRQANSVFVKMPDDLMRRMHRKGWHFYNDVGPGGAARLMCAWDSKLEDVDAFIRDLK